MTKQKQVFIHFCKCIKNKLRYHIYIFRPFTQYFVEAALAAITASSLLEYDTTSLAHLYLESFSHSSLQILSNQVGWGASLHSYFQVSPEMFDWVQGCVLRVVVLLELCQ